MNDICSGCDHPFRLHVKNVLDEVICLVSYSTTTKGVVSTLSIDCDCVDGVSKRTNQKRKKAAIMQAERKVYADALAAAIDRGEIPELKLWEPECLSGIPCN